MSAYAELHCLSNFTFLRGASHPEELVERAHALGYGALAITDECSVSGAVRAHLAARRLGMKLILGTEVRLSDGPRLVLLAANREGWGNLCELITHGRRAAPKGGYRLERADLDSGLPGCFTLLLADTGTDPEEARRLAALFPGRCWIAVELHRGPDDEARLAAAAALGKAAGLPRVAAGDIHMHVPERRPLQDLLTAIRLGRPLAACAGALHPNGERHLRAIDALSRLVPPALLEETLNVAARCEFSLEELRYEYPDELVPAGETPAGALRRLTEEGISRRYGSAGPPAHVRALVEHELALIAELGYEPYFLTVEDIVAFARARGILCQGRGSAANSAVCYALGITEVDPARASMLFERFVSRERNEPPDIDVDFEHERREEVIQYLYAKYGRHRAALTATVIAYRMRSALRDAGRALGFDRGALDRLTRNLAWDHDAGTIPERLREAGFDPSRPAVALLVELATALIGFPRHLSQHVGGFVVSRGPLQRLVPIENAAMPERTVIQWDKDDLDALGLLKIDVLALGMLSAIRRALALVARRRGKPFGMGDIPAEDARVYDMLCRGDSAGVFQVESRAQISMLPRLAPRCFYDLVIEVAIIRPGPIQGGMVHPYLRRRQGLEPVEYPSPDVKRVLERTLGVPLFQEQVMQLAIVAAGFTPGEADRLRRLMASWSRHGGIERIERRLVEGMLRRGYAPEFARSIFRQIAGFGEYGFPESHAASFALLVYVSAWLKCHEPAAFLCALLNSQPMGFYAPAQLIQDARRHGVTVLAPEVTASDWDCTLEPDDEGMSAAPAVRLGLRMVAGLGEEAALRIVAARESAPFAGLEDLAARARLAPAVLRHLAVAGALAQLCGHRRQACWEAAGANPSSGDLGGTPAPEAPLRLPPPSEGEDLVADYRSLGLTLGRHPLALLRERLTTLRFEPAARINGHPDRKLARAAGLVTCRQRPGTAGGVVFVTIEDETGLANVIVHADLARRQHRELTGARLLGVYGRIEREGEVAHLVAGRLVDHSSLLGALEVRSRDFH
ncbi:MAG: error-prone DNA polymerase [Betaproteobacteria bacterium CG2_30_68_42]|nr:MAG: error-prone DNA polymerase [Betaproteobacteria bacterium CG2_30_68_42]